MFEGCPRVWRRFEVAARGCRRRAGEASVSGGPGIGLHVSTPSAARDVIRRGEGS